MEEDVVRMDESHDADEEDDDAESLPEIDVAELLDDLTIEDDHVES